MARYWSLRNGCLGPIGYLQPKSETMPRRDPAHLDEPVAANAARLALKMGYESLTDFARDCLPGMTAADLLSGQAHKAYSTRIGVPVDTFAGGTPIRQAGGACLLNQERFLPRRLFSFEYFSSCPHCLRSDAAFVGRTPDEFVVPHPRTWWFFRHVRACPIHEVALMPLRCEPCDLAIWADGGFAALMPSTAPDAAPADEILVAAFHAGRFGFLPPVAEPPEIAQLPFELALDIYKALGRLLPGYPDKPLNDHEALKRGLSATAGPDCQPDISTLGRTLDAIGGRFLGLQVTTREAYGSLINIAADAAGNPQLLPFTKCLLNSAAKYASDGAAPVAWLARWEGAVAPSDASPGDLFGFDYRQVGRKHIGIRAIAKALRCNARLALCVVLHLARKLDKATLYGKAGAPILAQETIDNFLHEFAPFAELAGLWPHDHDSLQEVLDCASVCRIDDRALAPSKRRLGSLTGFYLRKSAYAAMKTF